MFVFPEATLGLSPSLLVALALMGLAVRGLYNIIVRKLLVVETCYIIVRCLLSALVRRMQLRVSSSETSFQRDR